MALGKIFGSRPPGVITVVEPPLSQWYARKARVTFLAVAGLTGVLTAAVVAAVAHLLVALLLGALAGLLCGFVAAVVVRAWPLLRVLWWWSVEIAAAALVVLVPTWLARWSPWLALAVVVISVGVCAGVGSVRRRLAAWSWCVVVRHRLRLCFAEFVRATGRNRPGCLPLLLWARPTPAGERVWLWLRPGLDLSDLEGKAGKVAVSCWAGEARMVRASARFAALIRVDLTRRDPLTDKVVSPLAALVAHVVDDKKADTSVSPAAPPMMVGLDLADVPEPEPAPPPRGGRR